MQFDLQEDEEEEAEDDPSPPEGESESEDLQDIVEDEIVENLDNIEKTQTVE